MPPSKKPKSPFSKNMAKIRTEHRHPHGAVQLVVTVDPDVAKAYRSIAHETGLSKGVILRIIIYAILFDNDGDEQTISWLRRLVKNLRKLKADAALH